MFVALVNWICHEEFLEWLGIRVDEGLPRHQQTFLLNVFVIFSPDVISYYQKSTILEMTETLIEDRLCCL